MILRATIAVLCALALCGCYDTFKLPHEPSAGKPVTASLAELHGLWFGRPLLVEDDIVVGGVVTSSDRAGNFYRTFTICDESGAAEIMAGLTDLYNIYPVGCVVRIYVRGCAVSESRGVLQIGLPAADYENYDVDYFYSKVNLDRYIFRTGDMAGTDIPDMRLSELTVAMCGRPVTVRGLEPVLSGDDNIWSGYRVFRDSGGGIVCTYTNPYADFADEPLPAGLADITGILQYGSAEGVPGDCFILKMRSHEDCRRHN